MSISKLLVDVGGDADKLSRLKSDPDSVLNEYDMPDEHKTAIKSTLSSGDASHVAAHMSDEEKTQYGSVQVNIL